MSPIGWIPDVYPEEQISSSQWGNLIRDRVHHVFANAGERYAATPKDGMICVQEDNSTFYRYQTGNNGWVVMETPWRQWANPRLLSGADGGTWVWDKVGPYQPGLLHGTLKPETFLWYKIEYQTIHYIGSYFFLQSGNNGIFNTAAQAILIAEMPIGTILPAYAMVGSGGGYSNGAQVSPSLFLSGAGQMGGPCYVTGNQLFVVNATVGANGSRPGTTINLSRVSDTNISAFFPSIYPVNNDSFYVNARMPIGAVVE